MLTQEQADDLNLQLHKQEAAEIGLDKINQDLNKYTDMIRRVADMMKMATPEQKERIRSVTPRLLEEYNNLKLKKSIYEDSYREATSKINEYNILNAQQPQVANQTKGRTINTNSFDWNNRWNNEYKNGGGIDTTGGVEQTFPYTYGVNAMMNKNTITSPHTNGVNATLNRNYIPVSEATLPGWVSTVNGPRYMRT